MKKVLKPRGQPSFFFKENSSKQDPPPHTHAHKTSIIGQVAITITLDSDVIKIH